MSGLNECERNGMLKKTPASLDKAGSSLRIARENLNDAKVHYDNKMHKWAIIAAYMAMFHASRALLFRDGMKERSHYCLFLYIKERYRHSIEARYLHELDVLREQRHKIIYGDENIRSKEVEAEEADSAIKLAQGYIDTVKIMLSK